jgi:hypothetical protein
LARGVNLGSFLQNWQWRGVVLTCAHTQTSLRSLRKLDCVARGVPTIEGRGPILRTLLSLGSFFKNVSCTPHLARSRREEKTRRGGPARAHVSKMANL